MRNRHGFFFSKNRVSSFFKQKQTQSFFFHIVFLILHPDVQKLNRKQSHERKNLDKKKIVSKSFDTQSKIQKEKLRIANKKKTIAEFFRLSKMKIVYEIKEQSNKKTYSKTAYNKNAMAIFIITNDFADEKEFLDLKKIDVSTFKTMYQLMSDSKKKTFYRTAMQILISNFSNFIDQISDYFLIWLNKFRKKPHLSFEKKDFVSKLFFSDRIFKNKSRVEKIRKRLHRKIEKIQHSTRKNKISIKNVTNFLYKNFFQNPKLQTFENIRRSKNENLIYFSKKDFNNRDYLKNNGKKFHSENTFRNDYEYIRNEKNQTHYSHKKKIKTIMKTIFEFHSKVIDVFKSWSEKNRHKPDVKNIIKTMIDSCREKIENYKRSTAKNRYIVNIYVFETVFGNLTIENHFENDKFFFIEKTDLEIKNSKIEI